jgi:hypothetical protein
MWGSTAFPVKVCELKLRAEVRKGVQMMSMHAFGNGLAECDRFAMDAG